MTKDHNIDTASTSQPERALSGFEQRLLAEAARCYETAHGIDSAAADACARAADGDFEQRVIARAQALPIATGLTQALHQLRSLSGLVVALGLILATLAGATAAQVALGAQLAAPVNFFWVLSGLLGLHTLALLVWLAFICAKPTALTSGSLGGLAFTLGRRLTQWLHRGPLHLAAVQAGTTLYTRSAIGRWTLSAVSHALWLAFLVSCTALVIFILSTKQYVFIWETTILSTDIYVMLTRALACLPEWLGFATPDPAQIRASHWTGGEPPPPDISEQWAGLLVGCLVAYGLLPRLLLLLLSLLMRRYACQWLRLDLTDAYYAGLRERLLPSARSLGVVDADTIPQAAPAPVTIAAANARGPTAILGLEIEPPAGAWPPLAELDWLDLGFVDSRVERRRALERITSATPPPRLVVIVCSAEATPDRGFSTFIHHLQEAQPVPIVMVLTDGQRLRTRLDADSFAQRIDDWRRYASRAQVAEDQIIEVDLEHLTAASRAKLAAALGRNGLDKAPQSHLERAFELIMNHVRRWQTVPSTTEQAELQRALAALYNDERQQWQNLLQTALQEGEDRAARLQTSADRMVQLLPERLRTNTRWLAAGALTGALGCVAAATLATPAAIAALPLWTGLGALIAAVMPASHADSAPTAAVDLGEAVSSAALFALILELQGRDEVTITRLLDRVFDTDEPPTLTSPEAAQQWLDGLRQRFYQALAEAAA